MPSAAAGRAPGHGTAGERLAELAVWALIVVTPLVVLPTARDPFRPPKLLVAEWLALASLLPLAWLLRTVPAIRPRDLWASPAVRAVVPALAVATAGLATSAHPLHVREGLFDLWIGAACLVGWSLGLSGERLERLLGGLLWPASAVALVGILQFHGVWEPLGFAGIHDPRLTVTSTTGNPGDLAAFLVLPCLIAQRRLAGSRPGLARWATAAALVLCVYGLAITQTLAAIAAVAAGKPQHREQGDHRAELRQQDVPEHLGRRGAVDQRRLLQVARAPPGAGPAGTGTRTGSTATPRTRSR